MCTNENEIYQNLLPTTYEGKLSNTNTYIYTCTARNWCRCTEKPENPTLELTCAFHNRIRA
ncbi:unnamed protein product [Schistosoma margrebowiei]|uniref:Uncharacterized protein n=1 Tax=Schistosoma margrebowiei TaxID=48269 RepID=A0A183LDP6_9TREM|nr:unnamed protein product [Schistosoma margrebowiei]